MMEEENNAKEQKRIDSIKEFESRNNSMKILDGGCGKSGGGFGLFYLFSLSFIFFSFNF